MNLSPIWPALLKARCGLGIAIPHIGTFRRALLGEELGDLAIKITGETPQFSNGHEGQIGDLNSLFIDAAIAQFLVYYETNIDTIKSAASYSVASLTPVWGFARVVRNAIGHGGIISISDQSFSPVSWAHLTYGPDDNGRQIMGVDLEMPDLMLLMLDMDVTLEGIAPTALAPRT